ncbi:hypothetical protein [Clostridium sp. D53t1_180928_C8]|uniref:hypothetical protein n=1 Tax=Clostridium sp. D53t1_180928_C8 TaxID=2787101 RepID=UPI0018AB2E88|nr:hypothetical protein [Clostridium sp. D53t1_180928_C8]
MNKSIKEFLGWILKYLIIVFTTIVLVIGGNLLFVESHKLISHRKSFLLYTISSESMGAIMILIASVIGIIIVKLNRKFLSKKISSKSKGEIRYENIDSYSPLVKWTIEMDRKISVISKNNLTKFLYIIFVVGVIIFSYTNYTAVTNDEIIYKTVFSDKVYYYDDVERLELGFTKGQDSNVYYNLVMSDGTKISLIGGSIEVVDERYENVVYEIDSKLQSLGKSKVVDRFYIEDFKNNGYNQEYVERVLRLFE